MNIKKVLQLNPLPVLKASAFFVFIGRAYQHFFWDAPYRAFFWDENLFGWVATNILKITWNQYVTSSSASNYIVLFIKSIGMFFLFAAIIVLYLKPSFKKTGKLFLLGGGFLLIILAFLYSKDHFFHVGQFFEYTCQFISPILLYIYIFKKKNLKALKNIALIAIALTFTCHGLYAIGYYPRPGNYLVMTLNILPISEPTAHSLLKLAGFLDFIIAIAIFIPKLSKAALMYAFIWGGITAIARLAGHFYIDFLGSTFSQWTWEMIIRFPHALIPLFVLIIDEKTHNIA